MVKHKKRAKTPRRPRSSSVARTELAIGIIGTLLQLVVPVTVPVRIAIWLVILALSADVIWRSPWTYKRSVVIRSALVLLVAALVGWQLRQLLREPLIVVSALVQAEHYPLGEIAYGLQWKPELQPIRIVIYNGEADDIYELTVRFHANATVSAGAQTSDISEFRLTLGYPEFIDSLNAIRPNLHFAMTSGDGQFYVPRLGARDSLRVILAAGKPPTTFEYLLSFRDSDRNSHFVSREMRLLVGKWQITP